MRTLVLSLGSRLRSARLRSVSYGAVVVASLSAAGAPACNGDCEDADCDAQLREQGKVVSGARAVCESPESSACVLEPEAGRCLDDSHCPADNTCDNFIVDNGNEIIGAGECVQGSNGVATKVEGDPCEDESTLACGDSANGTETNAVLACLNGTLERVFACPGLQQCEVVQGFDNVRCGGSTHYAVAGLPCANDSTQVCTFDTDAVLKCDGGTWVEAIHCPPSACSNVDDSGSACSGHFCSNCGYSLGDMCEFQAGGLVCSTDLGQIFQCANGRTTLFEQCPSGTSCTIIVDGTLECR